MKKFKIGISIITLVVSIIVIIILAGSVILILQKSNPIKQAQKARFLNDVETFKEELEMYKNQEYIQSNGKFDPNSLNAPSDGIEVSDLISSLKNSSYSKDDFTVENGKLVYKGKNQDYITWLGDTNIVDNNMIDTGYNKDQGVNGPVMSLGMTPIKWDNNVLNVTNINDKDWYSYTSSEKRWANAQTKDGSMWVWIPRYAYKIDNPHTAEAQEIHIKFLKGTSNETSDGEALPEGYIVEPAFTFGDTQLAGIWVAKFEPTAREGVENSPTYDNVITKHVKVVPNSNSWKYTNISVAFDVCRNMEKDSSYGWNVKDDAAENIDTHMMKNVEWGSIAYLTQSEYGIDSEVQKNNDQTYTGGGKDDAYIENVDETTTGNVYGIYDMVGGLSERVSAYVDNGNKNLIEYGKDLVEAQDKYKDVYEMGQNDSYDTNYNNTASRVGDAIYETSDLKTSAWYGNNVSMPNGGTPFIVRGGYYNNTYSYAGLFQIAQTDGYHDGTYGFRPVIVVGKSL